MVLGFLRRLSLLPEGSLHLDILRDNIADAWQPLMCANWAAGVDKQFRVLGMGSPFISSGIGALDRLGFMSRSAKRHEQVWENLHVSPQTAPSKGAKLCIYHHWFGRPSNLRFEPYYELPMGISKLWALVQFRLGSHALPIGVTEAHVLLICRTSYDSRYFLWAHSEDVVSEMPASWLWLKLPHGNKQPSQLAWSRLVRTLLCRRHEYRLEKGSTNCSFLLGACSNPYFGQAGRFQQLCVRASARSDTGNGQASPHPKSGKPSH